jgi:hypothetical protein
MNFGKWIVVAYVFFGVFIGTLVTVCVKQDVNLVSKNYYNDELGYADQITRINNARALVNNLNVVKGEMKLFCPSDPKSDKVFTLSLNTDNSQSFEINDAKSGMYKARLLWTMGGKEYFVEEIINI